jgi:hypothetical protein
MIPMRELKIFSGRANPALSRRICQFLNLAVGKIFRTARLPVRSTRMSAGAMCF